MTNFNLVTNDTAAFGYFYVYNYKDKIKRQIKPNFFNLTKQMFLSSNLRQHSNTFLLTFAVVLNYDN